MQQAEKTGLNCWGFITGKITLIKTSKQSILINEEEVNDCDIYGYMISKWNFRMENNGEGGEWEIFTFQWMPIQKGCVCLVIQSCPTLCDPMDCSLPGSSVHRDFPGKVTGVDCHALSSGSSQPRDWLQVSRIAGGFFTNWVTREALFRKVVVCNHLICFKSPWN